LRHISSFQPAAGAGVSAFHFLKPIPDFALLIVEGGKILWNALLAQNNSLTEPAIS
jgi:hypothetical protein